MADQLRNKQGLTESEFLAQYDPGRFPRPSVTVDTMILRAHASEGSAAQKRELQVLLVQRGDHPCIGQWALPGGFVNMDESLDQAAERELQEETGLENISMEQLFTAGNPERDPRTRIISTVYLALARDGDLGLQAGDDAADARWFGVRERVLEESRTPIDNGIIQDTVVELELESGDIKLSAVVKVRRVCKGPVLQISREVISSSGIAFDHAEILQQGLDSLKSKILNSAAVFNLLPETFNFAELLQLSEHILNRALSTKSLEECFGKYLLEAGLDTSNPFVEPIKLYRYRVLD